MGTVTDLRARRRAKSATPGAGQFVVCVQCGERHPAIRLAGGAVRCVTAFADDDHWFCRNRGCRATWLARQPAK